MTTRRRLDGPDRRSKGLPILGQLTPLGRGVLIATVAVSAVAILGLAWVVGLSTERLGSLTSPQVGGS